MPNVNVSWDFPTTRESGRPISADEIAGVELALSADNGANFAVLTEVVAPNKTYTATELEPGAWMFRAVVIDTHGARSKGITANIEIPDTSVPGDTQNLTLQLAAA